MTGAAWIFLIVAWSVISGSTAYCFYRLLTSPRRFADSAGEGDEVRTDR